jgi:hypothetical protein
VAGSQSTSHATNVGAGGLVLPAAGLEARIKSRALQVSVSAVRARFISESGVMLQSSSTGTTANSTGPGVTVEGLWVSGGAPVSAQRTGRTLWTARQVVRGTIAVPVSVGATITETRQQVAATPNVAGAFVFDSIDAFEAAREGLATGSRTYVRAPSSYGVVDRLMSGFAQSTLVRSSSLEVNAGIRFDYQSRAPLAVSPRVAVTGRRGRLTLDAGAGVFARPVASSVFLAEQASTAGATPYIGRGVSLTSVDTAADLVPVRTVVRNDIQQAQQV